MIQISPLQAVKLLVDLFQSGLNFKKSGGEDPTLSKEDVTKIAEGPELDQSIKSLWEELSGEEGKVSSASLRQALSKDWQLIRMTRSLDQCCEASFDMLINKNATWCRSPDDRSFRSIEGNEPCNGPGHINRPEVVLLSITFKFRLNKFTVKSLFDREEIIAIHKRLLHVCSLEMS
eukprot:756481-Hanusia_phi.AAC.2